MAASLPATPASRRALLRRWYKETDHHRMDPTSVTPTLAEDLILGVL